MASLDSLQTRFYAGKGVVRQVKDDTPVALRLRYIGTGTVTSVTVDNTAEEIVLITSDGGTDTYTVAANATIGAMADAINKDGIFEAMVIDALRSDSSDDTLINGAVTAGADANGVVVWDLKTDTSALAKMTVCLSPKSPDWNMPTGHRVSLQEIVYNLDLTAAADSLRIYRRRGTVETQIFGALTVDTTATTINFASGEGKITGNTDEELVVQAVGTVIDATANFLRVTGFYE